MKDTVSLAASAVLDTAIFTIARKRSLSPRIAFSASITAPVLDARFSVRAWTDDIYNVLPFRERDVHDALLAPLRAGDVFVDVGANIGYYTVLAAKRVAEGGAVIAVEPVPETVRQLQRNVALNGLTNVRVVPAALQAGGNEQLRLHVVGGLFGLGSSVPADAGGLVRTFDVAATTLDDVCQHIEHVRMVKLDVEGAEYAVLQGGRATLKKTDYLVVECNAQADVIRRLLEDAGFHVRKLRFSSYILAERAQVPVDV